MSAYYFRVIPDFVNKTKATEPNACAHNWRRMDDSTYGDAYCDVCRNWASLSVDTRNRSKEWWAAQRYRDAVRRGEKPDAPRDLSEDFPER